MAFDASGNAFGSVDLVFAEGRHAAQIPEPGSLALLSLAGLGVMVASRRRRNA